MVKEVQCTWKNKCSVKYECITMMKVMFSLFFFSLSLSLSHSNSTSSLLISSIFSSSPLGAISTFVFLYPQPSRTSMTYLLTLSTRQSFLHSFSLTPCSSLSLPPSPCFPRWVSPIWGEILIVPLIISFLLALQGMLRRVWWKVWGLSGVRREYTKRDLEEENNL